MYFLSREGRVVLDAVGGFADDSLTRACADQVALMFSLNAALSLVTSQGLLDVVQLTPSMADCPTLFRFTDQLDAYAWITEQFVTRDFPRVELVKLAHILRQYDLATIQRVAQRCKHVGHYTIPYLAGALDQHGSEAIEELRREERLERMAAETPKLDLPALRPRNVREQMAQLAEDRRFDDVLRGRKR